MSGSDARPRSGEAGTPPGPPKAETARERILARVRQAARGHEPRPHPGAAPPSVLAGSPEAVLEAFAARLTGAGGEVVRVRSPTEARALLEALEAGHASAVVSRLVPATLRPGLPAAPAETAELAVSWARCAVAETGSLLLDSREGRRLQLLAPTHLVWVPAAAVLATLAEALERVRADRGAALAFHSGPSKSADIGGVLVRGVHGPGRLIAAVIEAGAGEGESAGR